MRFRASSIQGSFKSVPFYAEGDALIYVEVALFLRKARSPGRTVSSKCQSASPTQRSISAGDMPGIKFAACSDARAGNAVDWDSEFFERFEYVDVSDARRSAAAQHEADLWAMRRAALRLCAQNRIRKRQRGRENHDRCVACVLQQFEDASCPRGGSSNHGESMVTICDGCDEHEKT